MSRKSILSDADIDTWIKVIATFPSGTKQYIGKDTLEIIFNTIRDQQVHIAELRNEIRALVEEQAGASL